MHHPTFVRRTRHRVVPSPKGSGARRGVPLVALLLLGLAVGELRAGEVRADFNGDGFADLAVGVPEEGSTQVGNLGVVNVLYGSPRGLASDGNQLWHQDSPGVLEVAERSDRFGSSLAAGDFNGDGFGDLAVGVTGEDLGDVEDAGAVNVLYGSATGLASPGNQVWHEDSPGVLDEAEPEDRFGSSLAAGDFNGDGFTDLAVGVLGEAVAGFRDAGAAHVLYGSGNGLSADGTQHWHEDSPGVQGEPAAEDKFGFSLAAGDFDGDGFADLAIGVPSDDVGAISNAGSVSVLRGSEAGLSSIGHQLWHQDRGGVAEEAEASESFGWALAAGDFDADGFADLAVGVPGESVRDLSSGGAVNVLYGSASGLSAAGNQLWHQDIPGVRGIAESSDAFGTSLAAADFDGDGFADLAISVPDEGIGNAGMAGAVHVLHGSADGLSSDDDQLWHQNRPGILDRAEEVDRFGNALAAGDFNRDGFADLAVGILDESTDLFDVGAVAVLYGSPESLSPAGNQLWTQDSPGILDLEEPLDEYGSSLAAGDS